jgi:hypothetical protein
VADVAMQGAPFARPWRVPEPRRWSVLELITWLALLGVVAALVALGPLLMLLAGFGRPRPFTEGPAVPRALVVMVWGWLLGPASLWLQSRVGGTLPLSKLGFTVTFTVSLAVPFVVARTTSALAELPGGRRAGAAARRPNAP